MMRTGTKVGGLSDVEVGKAGHAREPYDIIPPELQALPQWVAWRYEERDGERTKVPVRVGPDAFYYKKRVKIRKRASTTDPATWSPFLKTYDAYINRNRERDRIDGFGFVFAETDPYVGIDFDGCLLDGEIMDWAREDIEALGPTYCEVSPSGNGLKLWARGRLSGTGTRYSMEPREDGVKRAIEIYDRARFFTVTANAPDPDARAIEDRSEFVNQIYERIKPPPPVRVERHNLPPPDLTLSDSDLIEKAEKARNGAKFARLYRQGDLSDYGGDPGPAHTNILMR